MCGAWQRHFPRPKAPGLKSWNSESGGDSGTRTSYEGLPDDAGSKVDGGTSGVNVVARGAKPRRPGYYFGVPPLLAAHPPTPIEVVPMHRSIVPIRIPRLALAAALLAAAACSPPSITSERNSTIPIPAAATVAFVGSTSEGTTQVDPAVSNDIMHARIQAAINTQLQKKGYTVVDSSKPSTFHVRYYVGVKQSTSYVTTTTGVGMAGPYYGGYGGYGYGGYGYGWGGYGGMATSTTSPVTNTNVSFVVDLVEASSGKTAWRGIYNGEAQSSAPSDSRLNNLATSIFSTLPKVP
jgi:hypothetical protein